MSRSPRTQRIADGVTLVRGAHAWIFYYGEKEDLLKAGVATESMFPRPGLKRRNNWFRAETAAERFCVSAVKGGFKVTRWEFWNDPEGAKREQEKGHRAALLSATGQETRGGDEKDAEYIALMRLPNAISWRLSSCAQLLRTEVTVSPVMKARLVGAAKFSAELDALAERIKNAEIEEWTTLNVVSIR